MCSHPIRSGFSRALLLSWLLVACSALWSVATSPVRRSPQSVRKDSSPSFQFVRSFSSPSDLKPAHEILNRTLDIVAGAADPTARVDTLKIPVAITTDSKHRVFVADRGAKTVHVFDFEHSHYFQLDPAGSHLTDPVALAADAQGNIYVADQISRAIVVFDAAGKFRRMLGKLHGNESYFESPTGIAVDRSTGRIYVCDRSGHTIFAMDQHGKIIRRIGKRGGGDGPAEFRLPSEIVMSGNELYVLDAGNKRIQVLDTAGHFLRSTNVGYAGHGTGFAVDAEHNIYLTDPTLNQIEFMGRGTESFRIIDLGAVKGASLIHPSGLWIDASTLYAIDSQENRVTQFEIVEDKK